MNFHRLVCVLLLSFSTATLAGKPPKSCQQVYYQPIQTYDQLKQTTAQQERNLKLFKQFSYGIVGLSAAGIAWGLSQWDDDVQAILNANDGIWVSPFTGEKLDINLLLDLRKLNYVQVVKKLTDQGIMVLHIDENSRFKGLNPKISSEDLAKFRDHFTSGSTKNIQMTTIAMYLDANRRLLKTGNGDLIDSPFVDTPVILVSKFGEDKTEVLHHEYLHHLLTTHNPWFHTVNFEGQSISRLDALQLLVRKHQTSQEIHLSEFQNFISDKARQENVEERVKVFSHLYEYYDDYLTRELASQRLAHDSKLHELTVYYLQLISQRRFGLDRESIIDLAGSGVEYCHKLEIDFRASIKQTKTILESKSVSVILSQEDLEPLNQWTKEANDQIYKARMVFLRLVENVNGQLRKHAN